ncbi:MAG: DUF3500 domain-containing protein [Bryobacterales bacterium]|nr:DUF3500 domain-containing protein [Bryobacterales bacterium]
MTRRDFLAVTSAAAAAAPGMAAEKAAHKSTSETLVATLFKSLTAEQRPAVVFPFDHALRSKVDANWFIVPQKIGQFFNRDQQAMIREIFTGLYRPEFAPKVMAQVKEDAGGIENYSAALFGEPGGKFEFVITGRHCTMRCDGDSVDGAAFGGPIMYGHQSGPNDMEAPDHGQNVYWYQARRANEVFAALDGKQRELALVKRAPRAEAQNKTVQIKPQAERAGIPVSGMSKDQRGLVEKVLADLLLPYRQRDADEAMKLVKARGGVEALHMSFYKNLDVGNDGVWDVWQLEGPGMVWYFRGYPHVHTWVNVQA